LSKKNIFGQPIFLLIIVEHNFCYNVFMSFWDPILALFGLPRPKKRRIFAVDENLQLPGAAGG